MEKLTIVHVITGLGTGGAEHMLYRLLKSHRSHKIKSSVISLTGKGTVGKKIQAIGVPVYVIEAKPGKVLTVRNLFSLLRILREVKPEIIQGWMYHGNLAATIIALFSFPPIPVYWNIRQSLNSLSDERPLTKNVIKLGAILSRLPKGIIYNSRLSIEQHERIGFSPKRRYFIPNGFDIPEVSMAEGQNLIRQDGQIGDETKWIIGHIARFHPKKDHVTFFEAARLVLNQRSDVLFLAVGRGIERSNAELWKMIQMLKLENDVRLVGETENISDIYSSLNMLVSSSCWGEGFPNVIAEAMASGIVCVGTDVGETAHVIGSTGTVVLPRDPVALAEAILGQLSLPLDIKRAMSLEARSRISELFALEKIAQEYLSIYRLRT